MRGDQSDILGGAIIDEVCKKNANGDIELEQYVKRSSNSRRCNLRKEDWHSLLHHEIHQMIIRPVYIYIYI
jgi:hypothetical protein